VRDQVVVGQAQAPHGLGGEVLGDGVGGLHEGDGQLPTLGVLEVDGDAALVGVQAVEQR
jgi:hypothetical protein